MASHSVGKTHGSAGIVLWHYHSFSPSITLTTAPTDAQVVDLLWKEVRSQAPAGTPLMPKAPEIADPTEPMHYAKGYVARDSNAFQGRHEEHLLVLFDEATGVKSEFWNAADGMLTSGDTNRHLAILNPTDVSSRAYAEYDSGDWNVIRISAVEHPNVVTELADDSVTADIARTPIHDPDARRSLLKRLETVNSPVPFPKAVRLSWVVARVAQWCSPISASEHVRTDFEFPPGSNVWYRPGPLFEGRVMGRWPSTSIDSVWSDALFEASVAPLTDPEFDSRAADQPPVIGCDVARFGNDLTSIHVRVGSVSVHHESHNGWSTSETAGRLKQLADLWGHRCGLPGTSVSVRVDDDGVGGGVVDQAGDYDFVPCSGARASTVLNEVGKPAYPNRRSEAWFQVADLARRGLVNLSRLDADVRHELRRQLLAPLWKLDSAGRQAVERKADTKKRLERSPDDADAMNLAYAPTTNEGMNVWEYYSSQRPATGQETTGGKAPQPVEAGAAPDARTPDWAHASRTRLHF